MNRDERKKAIQSVTDELLTSKFTSTVGQKAHVERSKINNEHMEQLRDVIREVGLNLKDIGVAPKMDYIGSLCVHVYKSEILNQVAFVTTSALDKMTFDVADGALRELTGTTLESYGRSRRKLRSGF